MEETLLKHFQDQLVSQDEWTVGELSDFFGVSHTTIRNQIERGEITARKKEIEGGYKWVVSGDEAKRNLSQSETLQRYIEKKLKDGDKEGLKVGEIPTNGEGKNKGKSLGGDLVGVILSDLQETRNKLEKEQEKVAELREEKGTLRERIKHLEKENKELRAELERRPEPNALPAKIEQGRRETLEKIYNLSSFAGVLVQSWVERDKGTEDVA
jgi:transcriptional antiterminator